MNCYPKLIPQTIFSVLFLKYATADNEIDNYLRANVQSEKTDILAFWNINKEQYPILSTMTRDFFCIPATYVSCEEIFSDASDLITKKRNNLSSKLIEEIMCIDSWIDSD